MRHNLLISLLCLLPISIAAESLDWPVKDTANLRLSSTFGESRLDHFHNGIDIPGKGFNIYAVASGDLIYSHSDFHWPGELPFGGGNTVVIDHGSQVSGYMHLETSFRPNDAKITRESPIGSAGNTGHSGGAHLHFFIYEKSDKAFLNPLQLLPMSPLTDSEPPKVFQYGVLLPNKFATINIDEEFTMTDEYPICAQLIDSSGKNERWGIYQVSLLGDSAKTNYLTFDKIYWQNNRWRTTGGKDFDQVYSGNFVCLGKGFRKSKKLNFEARGYQGPALTVRKKLKIKLEQ